MTFFICLYYTSLGARQRIITVGRGCSPDRLYDRLALLYSVFYYYLFGSWFLGSEQMIFNIVQDSRIGRKH